MPTIATDPYEQRGVQGCHRPLLSGASAIVDARKMPPPPPVAGSTAAPPPLRVPRLHVTLEDDTSDEDSDDEIYIVKVCSPATTASTAPPNTTVARQNGHDGIKEEATKENDVGALVRPSNSTATSTSNSNSTLTPNVVSKKTDPQRQTLAPRKLWNSVKSPRPVPKISVPAPKQASPEQQQLLLQPSKVEAKQPSAFFKHSPYEKNACAEDGEVLFEQLKERLESFSAWEEALPVREYYMGIMRSAILYSTCWEQGRVHDKDMAQILPPRLLVLCLQSKLICRSTEVSVLLKICQNGLEDMVRAAVDDWQWSRHYPKLAAKTSRLAVRRVDVLKSILFVCRVYGAMDSLNVPRLRDVSNRLRYKLQACLAIVEEHVEVDGMLKKRRGRKKESTTAATATQMEVEAVTAPAPAVVHAAKTRIVGTVPEQGDLGDVTATSTRPGGGHKRKVNESAGTENAAMMHATKHRRVSMDVGTPSNVLAVQPAGDSGSFLQRLDQLEEYFSLGLAEVRRLRREHEASAGSQQFSESHRGTTPLLKREPTKNVVLKSVVEPGHVGVSSGDDGDDDEEEEAEWNEDLEAKHGHTEEDADESLPSLQQEPDEQIVKRLHKLIRSRVFRNVKVIKDQKQLTRVITFLSELPGFKWSNSLEDLGDRFSSAIRHEFAVCRKACQSQMKNVCFKYMDEHNGKLIAIEHVRSVRKSQSTQDITGFMFYWNELLPCVTGAQSPLSWGRNKLMKIISDGVHDDGFDGPVPLVTVSDEAFTIWLYENGYAKWKAMWQKERRGRDVQVPEALYIVQGVHIGKEGEKDFKNWTDVGQERFKELTKYIKRDRADDVDHNAERRMLNRLRSHKGL